jgi:hypothetical protein
MSVTTATILDPRRKRNGTKDFPLAIRVTFRRVPVFSPLGIDLTKEDFKKLTSPHLGTKLSQFRELLKKEHERANEII